MKKSERAIPFRQPNPWKFGGIPLRYTSGTVPSPERIAQAASLLAREPTCVDSQGFECEILAATVHRDGRRIVYVESRAKERPQYVDITIKIHYVDSAGKASSVDIESYNPFFGCDVGFLEWFNDDVALLIYTEKHWTFAYRIGDRWPPAFVKIEERWQVRDNVLSYMSHKAEIVKRLQLPGFETLPDLPIADAEATGQLPPDPYAG
jgi:hypothetical protein